MMIRGLTVSLLFSVLALPAYAQDSGAEPLPQPEQTSEPAPQDNPQTRQTDEDEDEYRRSQRRRDTGDIFEDIVINRRGSGSGGTQVGPEVKAIDRLDQDSRRHLNKQRAKALAEAQPGEPIDAAYEPSEVAKTDEYVAKQEQRAWEEMLREANNGIGVTQGPKGGSGQSGTGEAGQGDGGQAGGQGQDPSGQGSSGQAPRPVRGGSATSAAAILDQIKGRSIGSGSEGSQGQTAGQSGQSSSGQASSGQGESTQAGGSSSSASSILDQIKGRSGSRSSQQGQTAGGAQSPFGQSPLGQGQSGQGTSTQSGGSSSSASAILNQIKGLGGSSGSQQGQSPQGQTSQGQGTQGQSTQGQSGSQAQAPVLGQSGQSESNQSAESTQSGGSASSAASILDQLRGTNTSSQQGQTPAQGQPQTTSGSAADTAAEAAAHRETISPLEFPNRDPLEPETTGGRTSASDFLNRGKE